MSDVDSNKGGDSTRCQSAAKNLPNDLETSRIVDINNNSQIAGEEREYIVPNGALEEARIRSAVRPASKTAMAVMNSQLISPGW